MEEHQKKDENLEEHDLRQIGVQETTPNHIVVSLSIIFPQQDGETTEHVLNLGATLPTSHLSIRWSQDSMVVLDNSGSALDNINKCKYANLSQ